MSNSSYEKISMALTGNFDHDRDFVLSYIFERIAHGDKYIATEILALALNYLPTTIDPFTTFLVNNGEKPVAFILLALRDKEIDIFIRRKVADMLVTYAKKREPTKKPTKGRFSYNLTSPFEKLFYEKVANTAKGENLEDFPYFAIFYEAAHIYLELGQQISAFPLLGLAHQWNPFSPKVINNICEFLKHENDIDNLMRLSAWFLRIVYSFDFIGIAMRYVGYAYFKKQEYEKAYAFYYQSLIYEEKGFTPNLNEELMQIIHALGKEEPYELSKRELKELFPQLEQRPLPNEMVFDVVRDLMVRHYINEEYTEVLRFANDYLRVRPSDTKIKRIVDESQIALA